MIGSVVEHATDRIVCATEDAFHAVDRAEIMAAVDAFAASGADENVLVVVGHADDFMRNDLTDGEDEIEAALRDELVDLCGPSVAQQAFGLLMDVFGGDFAECFDVGAPVVDAEEIKWDGTEHECELAVIHGRMRA